MQITGSHNLLQVLPVQLSREERHFSSIRWPQRCSRRSIPDTRVVSRMSFDTVLRPRCANGRAQRQAHEQSTEVLLPFGSTSSVDLQTADGARRWRRWQEIETMTEEGTPIKEKQEALEKGWPGNSESRPSIERLAHRRSSGGGRADKGPK